MKKVIIFFIIIALLSACTNKTNPSSSKNLITKNENHRLQIDFLEQTEGVVDEEKGFYLHFLISEVSGVPLDETNYSFALPRTLLINEETYEAKSKTVVSTNDNGETLPDNTLYFKQFFTPELPSGENILAFDFYVKPMYYTKEVFFNNLSHSEQNIIQNDLTIADLLVEDKNLTIILGDVHNLQGIEATLLIRGEEIYPVFTTTDYNEYNNTLRLSSQFAFLIPDDFTIKFKRHRLQDIVWEFPFILSVEK